MGLFVEYGSIENAFSHVEEISQKRARESLRENYQMAQLSKELATIFIHFSRIKFHQKIPEIQFSAQLVGFLCKNIS